MKNVLITGGASGLGKKIAEHLIERKYNVFIIDRTSPSMIDTAYYERISGYFQVDLSDIQKIKQLIQQKSFPRIDILINNAAIRLFKPFLDFTEEEIKLCNIVNVEAILIITYLLTKNMYEQGYGRIINISSRAAFYGYSTGSLYSSTKSFLLRLTESMANDFKKSELNITANTICPSAISNLDGKLMQGYEIQIRKIFKSINLILNSNVNGKCFNCFSLKEKIFYLYITIKNLF